MRTARTLDELKLELVRQQSKKIDFVADTRAMRVATVKADNSAVTTLENDKVGQFQIGDWAHKQLREDIRAGLGVSRADFYDRLRTLQPKTYDQMVNTYFQESPKQKMVRTLDRSARAYLSPRYRRMDNLDLLSAVLPTLEGLPGGWDEKTSSLEVTANHLYLKIVYPGIERRVAKVGDVVQAGVLIANSEVGDGSLSVKPMVFTLVCGNGMVADKFAARRTHVGRSLESTDDAYELYSDETVQADDRALWLKVRDTVSGVLSGPVFEEVLESVNRAAERQILQEPTEAIKVLSNRLAFTEAETKGIQGAFFYPKSGNVSMTQYGLSQAVTQYAQSVPDYERYTELERAGGQIITLPPTEWEAIAGERPAMTAVL